MANLCPELYLKSVDIGTHKLDQLELKVKTKLSAILLIEQVCNLKSSSWIKKIRQNEHSTGTCL